MNDVFVAPEGRAGGAGTADSPLSSLADARVALRRMRQQGATGPVTVWLRGGTYRLSKPFVLAGEDGGTPEAPVVYRACPGEEVRLSGAVPVPAAHLQIVTEDRVLDRLGPDVRGKLVQIDLSALGFAETGGREPRGFAFPERPADLDLFDGDRPLPIARWPREGYAATGTVIEKGTPVRDPANGSMGPLDPSVKPCGATFTGEADRIRRWSHPRDLLCFGLWAYDWAPSTVPVLAADPKTGTFTLTDPCYGGVLEGKPYCVLNAVEEIAQPGDWAVDRESRLLYLYPPGPLAELKLTVSSLKDPLVILDKVSHLELRDLVFEGGRGHGLTLDGDHLRVAGCTFRNLGGRAVNVEGRDNRVQSCHIHATGQGGIRVSGGDRPTLTPSGHVIDNNAIHDFNRVCMTYNAAVWLLGCGHRVAHNRLYDGPHNAILLHGNDHVIEYNEIDHMALVCDDASAVYMGRNPSELGNTIRYNYFHHIGTPTGWGTSAIYPDDGACGLIVRGNVFYRCGHAGQACMGAFFGNGGKDHVIENNVFIDCRIAVGLMLMNQKQWEALVGDDVPTDTHYTKALYREVDIRSDLWRNRYPALADLLKRASSNVIRRNLAVRCGVLVTPEDERQAQELNWVTDQDPGFADLARLDFQLARDSDVFRRIPGFEPVPFHDMGLRRDEFRTDVPVRGEVDCRPELERRPVVRGPGEKAPARLLLHFHNGDVRPVSGEATVWANHPGSVSLSGATRPFALAPGEVRTETVDLDVTARPGFPLLVGARVSGSAFSLPVPVSPLYRIRLSRLAEAPALDRLAAGLQHIPELTFLADGRRVGSLRLAMAGPCLAVAASLEDARSWPGQAVEGMWGGPLLGLLAASSAARDASAVRQPVFFPHGPAEAGTLWFFEGPRQVTPPASIRWSACARNGGWDMAALLPLATLGLPEDTVSFRLEAMANLVLAVGQGPRLVTLFGSQPARLELETLAELSMD